MAKMIAVNEKYALEVGAPTAIQSDRQHEEYLAVLDRLMGKANPSREEEKYAEVLAVLIEAYEEENHAIPDPSPVGLRGSERARRPQKAKNAKRRG